MLRLVGLLSSAGMRSLGARRHRVQVGRHTLVVNEYGSPTGEPWVLLHGMGATAISWALVANKLRRDCRLLVPELSALGGSVGETPSLNVKEGVPAISRLIERLAPGKPVTLAGISLGGWIATRLALARPELVHRLVLINCAGYRDQDWERIQDSVTVTRPRDVDQLLRVLFLKPPPGFKLARRTFYAAYNSPPIRHVIETLSEEDAFDAGDLGRIERPVGLIWAEHDELFRLEVARAMRNALPRASLQVVDRCGHGIQWERPLALARAIERFRHELAG